MTSVLNDYIAGAIGGAAGLVVGHPFDTTKVQMQTRQTTSPYKSTWEAVKNISQQGMSRGFFRGMAFPVASYGLINSVFFGVYGNTLKFFKDGEERSSSSREVYLAGCVAGFAQLFVACPVDVVKVVLQSQIPKSNIPVTQSREYFKGPVQCTKWLIKSQGVSSLYKGFTTMIFRDVPTFGIYTLVYEKLYSFLNQLWTWDKHAVCTNLVAGGCAGITAWTPIMPFDNIKSLIQADNSGKYNGMIDCAIKLYKSRGISGFFTGTYMVWVRAFPVNAFTFLFYAKCLELMNKSAILWK